jgi:hypothetical protein
MKKTRGKKSRATVPLSYVGHHDTPWWIPPQDAINRTYTDKISSSSLATNLTFLREVFIRQIRCKSQHMRTIFINFSGAGTYCWPKQCVWQKTPCTAQTIRCLRGSRTWHSRTVRAESRVWGRTSLIIQPLFSADRYHNHHLKGMCHQFRKKRGHV